MPALKKRAPAESRQDGNGIDATQTPRVPSTQRTSHRGRQAIKLTNGTAFGPHIYGMLWQPRPLKLVAGKPYTMSAWVKSDRRDRTVDRGPRLAVSRPGARYRRPMASHPEDLHARSRGLRLRLPHQYGKPDPGHLDRRREGRRRKPSRPSIRPRAESVPHRASTGTMRRPRSRVTAHSA